jgi:hypothetical protein
MRINAFLKDTATHCSEHQTLLSVTDLIESKYYFDHVMVAELCAHQMQFETCGYQTVTMRFIVVELFGLGYL